MPMKSALTSSFLESSKFKKRHSVLIKLVDAMRDCGANLDLDIPTIVFCGNQSAGKSSLIEAISEIELPRSDGTCTRCPMEVRLSTSSSSWECVVSLRKEYDTNGKILDRPQEKYFGSVKAKKDVGLLVIRAQRALLNPERATDFFACVNLDDSPDDLQFTKNVVVLHIKGADIDLSLIDLPGIIRSVDDPNDNHLIPLVRSLVQVYIEKPKTIIVATISCKDDIDNQEVIQMAKSADPEGLRTLGVLTKPDTIELHCEAVWLELLKGLKYKLALGYTMVRNPSKKELLDGLTRTEARNLENQFFESTEPWRSLERDHKCQLGVANLSSELSDLLVRLIEINLPIMRETLQNSMESVDEQLSKLPRPLASNLQREYLDALQSLREHLDDVVSAKKNKDLYQAIMKESEEFFERIRQTRPKFVFGDKAPNDKDKLTYTDVQKLIRERKGRELPGHTSPEVTAEIIKILQRQWPEITKTYFKTIEATMEAYVKHVLQGQIGRFHRFLELSRPIVNTYLAVLSEATSAKLSNLLAIELYFPYTSNRHYFDTTREAILNRLQKEAKEYRVNLEKESTEKREQMYWDKSKTSVPPIPEIDNEVLHVMACCEAYFKVARKRFGDYIPLFVDDAYIRPVIALDRELCDKMNVFNKPAKYLEELFDEPGGLAERRTCLQQKEQKLKGVWKLIREVI